MFTVWHEALPAALRWRAAQASTRQLTLQAVSRLYSQKPQPVHPTWTLLLSCPKALSIPSQSQTVTRTRFPQRVSEIAQGFLRLSRLGLGWDPALHTCFKSLPKRIHGNKRPSKVSITVCQPPAKAPLEYRCAYPPPWLIHDTASSRAGIHRCLTTGSLTNHHQPGRCFWTILFKLNVPLFRPKKQPKTSEITLWERSKIWPKTLMLPLESVSSSWIKRRASGDKTSGTRWMPQKHVKADLY